MRRRPGRWFAAAALASLALVACSQPPASIESTDPAATTTAGDRAVAIFAGGCFWCMEPPFDQLDGVIATTSGYTGGTTVDPTYRQVTAGGTGHAEAVQVTYDPSQVTYQELLDVFWRNIDPLDAGGQFCDRGDQYRTAVFAGSDAEQQLAEQSKQALADSERLAQPIVTEIVAAGPFYPAEAYHQDYADANPIRYGFYRRACGRDARLTELWDQPPTH